MREGRRGGYYRAERADLAGKVGGKRGWFDCAERKMKKWKGKERECMIGFGQVLRLAVC